MTIWLVLSVVTEFYLLESINDRCSFCAFALGLIITYPVIVLLSHLPRNGEDGGGTFEDNKEGK
jgi:hypothetical protein